MSKLRIKGMTNRSLAEQALRLAVNSPLVRKRIFEAFGLGLAFGGVVGVCVGVGAVLLVT